MTQTDKNLLLIGSQYPQSIKNELLQMAKELGMKVIPASIGSFKSGERFCELYPGMQEQFIENEKEIQGAHIHLVMNMEDDTSRFMVDSINIIETIAEYAGLSTETGTPDIHYIPMVTPFTRQDRAFDDRMVSIMGKTFPKHIKCAGATRVTTVDVHSKAAEKFYTDYFGENNVRFLSANALFCQALKEIISKDASIKLLSPDGADKPEDVAQRQVTDLEKQFYGKQSNPAAHLLGIAKRHISENTTEITYYTGGAAGSIVGLRDDMLDSGTTLKNAAAIVEEDNAEEIIAMATHLMPTENNLENMTAPMVNGKKNPIALTLLTNSNIDIYKKYDQLSDEQKEHVQILSTIPLIKQALTLAA